MIERGTVSSVSRSTSSTMKAAIAHAIAAFVFLLLLLLTSAAQADVPHAAAPRAMPLRVLTFNVFGIAGLSPAIDQRMAAIGPAIVALDPDIVLVQELWRRRDAERLTATLEAAGFISVRSFGTDRWTEPGRSGLLIASKLAIVAERFEPFEAGRVPHIPWHVDWWGGKGFFEVRVATPLGEIGVVDVHAQASYATGQYEAIRIAQNMQMAEALARPGAVAAPDAPLILGGDVNAPPVDPSTRILEVLTRAHVEDRTLDTDVIMTRGGARIGMTVLSTERVLLEPLRLADGSSVPLSDHQGILVEMRLTACTAPCAPPARDPAADEAAAAVALAELDADGARAGWLRVATLVGALGSAWLAVRAARTLPTRPRRRGRALVVAFVLWCLFWSSWWTYTAFVFVPHHLATLEIAQDALRGGAAAWWKRHAPVTVHAPPKR